MAELSFRFGQNIRWAEAEKIEFLVGYTDGDGVCARLKSFSRIIAKSKGLKPRAISEATMSIQRIELKMRTNRA